jgi:hypothetical protein
MVWSSVQLRTCWSLSENQAVHHVYCMLGAVNGSFVGSRTQLVAALGGGKLSRFGGFQAGGVTGAAGEVERLGVLRGHYRWCHPSGLRSV